MVLQGKIFILYIINVILEIWKIEYTLWKTESPHIKHSYILVLIPYTNSILFGKMEFFG